jgi:hypothetical protein
MRRWRYAGMMKDSIATVKQPVSATTYSFIPISTVNHSAVNSNNSDGLIVAIAIIVVMTVVTH